MTIVTVATLLAAGSAFGQSSGVTAPPAAKPMNRGAHAAGGKLRGACGNCGQTGGRRIDPRIALGGGLGAVA